MNPITQMLIEVIARTDESAIFIFIVVNIRATRANPIDHATPWIAVLTMLRGISMKAKDEWPVIFVFFSPGGFEMLRLSAIELHFS